LVTFLVTVLLAVPPQYEGSVINLPIDVYRRFQNESVHSQFGVYLTNDQSNSLLSSLPSIAGINICLIALQISSSIV
jgi:hypothetical protein